MLNNMGSNQSQSPYDMVMKEKHAFDSKHKAMLDNIECILGHELNENMYGRKALEATMDNFVKEGMNQNGHYDQIVQQLVNTAKADKIKDDQAYTETIEAYTEIIRSNEVELSDLHKQEMVNRCDAAHQKEKQAENYLYDKEVLTPLEDLLYSVKLIRDESFRKLLLKLDAQVKAFKHELYAKHAENIYNIEDKVSVKDREYSYKHNIEVRDQLEEIIKASVTTAADAHKLKEGLCSAITQDRSDAAHNCTEYSTSISDVVHFDQQVLNKKYDDLLVSLKKTIQNHNNTVTDMLLKLPEKAYAIMEHGWYDIIYQKYRQVKYEIFAHVRKEAILPYDKREQIVNDMVKFRKENKEATEHAKIARHTQLKATLRKILVEDESNHINLECNALYNQLVHLILADKNNMDNKRISVYERLASLLKQDQDASDILMHELVSKVDNLYANGNSITEALASSQTRK